MLCFRTNVTHATCEVSDGVRGKHSKANLPLANPIPETPSSGSSPATCVKTRKPPAQSSQKLEGSEGCPSLTDSTLAISAFVLDTLQRASLFAPIPFLQIAASVALSIVQQAQEARGIRDDFQRLAKDACDLVYIVLVAHEARESEKSEKSNDLDSNLEDLVKTLTSIDKYAREKTKRSSVKRFLMFKSDIAKISEYRERLSHALNVFWLQSSIHVREQLAHIARQQGTTTVRDQNNSPSDRLAPRRIGADNDRIFDSFDEADIGNTANIRATGDIASGNTNLTRAFNNAQMGNTLGTDVEHVSDGALTDQNVYTTTIASDNHHLQDAFRGAVIGNTSAVRSSAYIGSGNKNVSRSFNGARIGNAVGLDTLRL
ncbi:hypothetical protein PILCRDRAFT_810744 [Piloderma croceum F 1598]|uniref:Uncharacterized protein n=1 Tax=Piloderma croceum (strain F 1598) TaxID=765440 RepID=A0A0C3BY48_PILCF|nr:hypothetical protein PILCRDRAFT_810744 [Piloderma croceum F 1598]